MKEIKGQWGSEQQDIKGQEPQYNETDIGTATYIFLKQMNTMNKSKGRYIQYHKIIERIVYKKTIKN